MKHIAIAGNPNSGKTTIFNYLTGQKEHVGNWMGVTVEEKKASLRSSYHGLKEAITIVDLPGTYSVDGYSEEELRAMNYLNSNEVDAIINVIDVSQLERSLMLTLALLKSNKPMVIALNKQDVAKKESIEIDVQTLESILSTNVYCTQAIHAIGLDDLMHALLSKMGLMDYE